MTIYTKNLTLLFTYYLLTIYLLFTSCRFYLYFITSKGGTNRRKPAPRTSPMKE